MCLGITKQDQNCEKWAHAEVALLMHIQPDLGMVCRGSALMCERSARVHSCARAAEMCGRDQDRCCLTCLCLSLKHLMLGLLTCAFLRSPDTSSKCCSQAKLSSSEQGAPTHTYQITHSTKRIMTKFKRTVKKRGTARPAVEQGRPA